MKSAYLLVMACLTAPLAAQANDAKFEECRQKLIQAQRLDLLHDLDFQGGIAKVVAGPTFFRVDFGTKQGFADTVNCFLMTGSSDCLNFDIRHWQTNRPVARYRACRLTVL